MIFIVAPIMCMTEPWFSRVDAMPQAQANGLVIEYESFGCKSDPTILLIMGVGAQLTTWRASFCEGLAARGFHVVRFDNRDVGKSAHLTHLGVPDFDELHAAVAAGQPFDTPYTLDDMANDAAALLTAIGVSDAHIAGVSMGGMIAQIFAAKYPSRTKSLISIMSTSGRKDLPPAKDEAMAALMKQPKSLARDDLVALAVEKARVIGSPAFAASEAELVAAAVEAVDRVPYEPTGAARQLAAIFVAPPRTQLLKLLQCPTLVLHGADDPLIPVACGEDVAACIKGARLVVVPGMGHDLTEALTPVWLEHIGGFLEHQARAL